MPSLKVPFRGLNTSMYPHRVPSGTADRAVNVTLYDGDLQRRKGFTELEDDVAADGHEHDVLNACIAHFADGDVYIVCKLADGTLRQRKIYPADAGSFTTISTSINHTGSDRGWFFMWADRLHYFDRIGGSSWNPDVNSGTAYKAGLPRPLVGPIIGAAAGGEKEGRYHVAAVYYNSATDEFGQLSSMQTGGSMPLECRIADNTGGIAISNWKTGDAIPGGGNYTADQTLRDHTEAIKHEWTHVAFFSSMGHTEYIGLGSGVECFSYRLYMDAMLGIGEAGPPGLNKADHVLSIHDIATNAGGEPPLSIFGCYDGEQAIYGGIYSGANLVVGEVQYSLVNHPTQVPSNHTYSIGGDSKTLVPKPWVGKLMLGTAGKLTDIVAGGGAIVAFTPTSATLLDKGGDGRLWPRLLEGSKGCIATGAAVGGPRGIHAMGNRSWLAIGSGARLDLATKRIEPTLAEIPEARRGFAVAARYGYRDQVWMAVVRPIGLVAQRILIYDESNNEFTTFDPACLGTRGSYSTSQAGGDNDLTFTAEAPGTPSTGISVEFTTGGTAGRESITVTALAIVIAIEAGVSTGQDVMDAFNLCADAVALATCTLKDGNDGTGTLPGAIAETSLSVGSDEAILAMCELALPNAEPQMLLFTDIGRVLQYPDGDEDEAVAGLASYASDWRGYFFQEFVNRDQRLCEVRTHAGTNVSGNVRLGVRAMRTADESLTPRGKVIQKSSLVDRAGVEFVPLQGNLFQLQFFSPHTVTAQWTIRDLALRTEMMKTA